MKLIGSISSLENEIKRKYRRDVERLENEAEKRIRKIRNATKAKLKEIDNEQRPIIKQAKELGKRAHLNEIRMKMKLEYQREKEKLVNQLITDVKKDMKKIAHSKEYLEYIKRHMVDEKDLEVYADSNYYQKLFKKKIHVVKGITGVKLVGKDITYDLTLESIMEEKLPKIKTVISRELV